METFELRYFLGVAATENVHRAADNLNVSAASLSKAIARLEDELELKLFNREGRGIRLTDQGRILQRRASEIIQLEESTRLELAGKSGTFQAVIAGPEILLSTYALEVSEKIKNKFSKTRFEFQACDEKTAIEKVRQGEAHLAFATSDLALDQGLESKVVGEVRFQTFVGKGHPLYSKAKNQQKISTEELLKYSFVSPSNPVLGQVGLKQSLDGWRDDRFPRKVEYLTSSLRTLETIVENGLAVAYLPDFLSEKMQITALKISDCDYVCKQKIKMIARNPKDRAWLSVLF